MNVPSMGNMKATSVVPRTSASHTVLTIGVHNGTSSFVCFKLSSVNSVDVIVCVLCVVWVCPFKSSVE